MTDPKPDYAALRRQMVNEQLRQRGIRDAAVLRAMTAVPREQFVLPEYRRRAYDDGPLPIPAGQTISQPYVVAVMIEALELSPTDHVLEIGAGSGYAAAVISRIVRRVTTIERHGELAQFAREKLRNLGYNNVTVHEGEVAGAGPPTPLTRPLSSPPAARPSPFHYANSWRSAAGWSCPLAAESGIRSWYGW
jgi:protein-L-isoaspartate(D-aspartate) O-methyltransferase